MGRFSNLIYFVEAQNMNWGKDDMVLMLILYILTRNITPALLPGKFAAMCMQGLSPYTFKTLALSTRELEPRAQKTNLTIIPQHQNPNPTTVVRTISLLLSTGSKDRGGEVRCCSNL